MTENFVSGSSNCSVLTVHYYPKLSHPASFNLCISSPGYNPIDPNTRKRLMWS
ncbi:hypothetical protein MAP00_009061 [Monascus purpureus]|nr:hypothetical protein MAP00_009061 [Monascus purpureus]